MVATNNRSRARTQTDNTNLPAESKVQFVTPDNWIGTTRDRSKRTKTIVFDSDHVIVVRKETLYASEKNLWSVTGFGSQ